MGALFRRHSKAEAAAAARRQQQEATAAARTSSSNQASSSNTMSVSVPNLTSTMEQTVSLLETFAMVARRNLGNNSSNMLSAVTGGNNNPCSSLVRLALSSNSPVSFAGSLLSAAQSFPNLTTSPASGTSTTLTAAQTTGNVTSLSQALTMSLTSTSSDSDNDFLEMCRTSTLLAELEDDEELPEPDEEMDDNEDDLKDDEEYDDVMDEDEYENHGGPQGRRAWDDEFVLKRQFSALIPAFDPRPGRTNVNQTQDFNISPPGTTDSRHSEDQDVVQQPKLALYLRGPNIPGAPDIDIPLDEGDATIFKFVQRLVSQSTSSGKAERFKRIWEPTYTILYRESKADCKSKQQSMGFGIRPGLALSGPGSLPWPVDYVERHLGTEALPKSELIGYLRSHADSAFLHRWRLVGADRNVKKSHNCLQLISAYKEFSGSQQATAPRELTAAALISSATSLTTKRTSSMPQDLTDEPACSMEDVLHLLQLLSAIASDAETNSTEENWFNVSTDEFFSKKITNKLVQQLQDALVLASNSTPEWCQHLTVSCPLLFPFETRQLYFSATAFGPSRAIVWLQNKRDATLERLRGPSPRREDTHEFRVGRLKHERVCVPRDDTLLEWAMQLMKQHAERKAVLEIEFKGEEGTGLGPTLEFYALVAAELQRKELGLWLCEDDVAAGHTVEIDIGRGSKPPGYYVQHTSGLFPAPLPQTSYGDMPRVESLFHFMGILFAKCIQDSRLIDVPLSRPLLKVICGGDLTDVVNRGVGSGIRSGDDDLTPTEPMMSPPMTPWYSGLLTLADFEVIDCHRAVFLRQLSSLAARRRAIESDSRLTDDQKQEKIKSLTLGDSQMHIDDLGLTFVFNPSSKVYGYTSFELKPNGENEVVNMDNIDEYVELVLDFCLNVGIRRQLEAFRAGFDLVFPMEKLFLFSPTELQMILCGDQTPQWTREDILNYTEPKLGYTKDSPGFQRLVNVLVEMSGSERKAFLQFTTGCSSLPPGGLANLQPRLTIVRKVDSTDGDYPSVNTCVHYLKLPEYSSEEILRDRLLAATKEKGFHLN
jgi:E3 ubiquitin-protein ligase HECTD1